MEVEEFLEHHGVKGMHWGIRNKRSANSGKKSSGKRKFARNLAIGVAGGVAVGAVAGTFVGKFLGAKGKVPISEMNKSTAKLVRDIGTNYAHDVLKSGDQISLNVIRNTARQIEDGSLNIIRR